MDFQVPAIYERGVLHLVQPIDLPEGTLVLVTISVSDQGQQVSPMPPRFRHPTRPQPLSSLEPLIGTMSAGGDAVADAEALYDEEW